MGDGNSNTAAKLFIMEIGSFKLCKYKEKISRKRDGGQRSFHCFGKEHVEGHSGLGQTCHECLLEGERGRRPFCET